MADRSGMAAISNRLREEDRNRHRWEPQLPSSGELTPLNLTLITPALACAFSIKEGGIRSERTEADAERAAQATLHSLYESSAQLGGKAAYNPPSSYHMYMMQGDSRRYYGGNPGFGPDANGSQAAFPQQTFDPRSHQPSSYSQPSNGFPYSRGPFPDAHDPRTLNDARYSMDSRFNVDHRYPSDPWYKDPRVQGDPRMEMMHYMQDARLRGNPNGFAINRAQGQPGSFREVPMPSELQMGPPMATDSLRGVPGDTRGNPGEDDLGRDLRGLPRDPGMQDPRMQDRHPVAREGDRSLANELRAAEAMWREGRPQTGRQAKDAGGPEPRVGPGVAADDNGGQGASDVPKDTRDMDAADVDSTGREAREEENLSESAELERRPSDGAEGRENGKGGGTGIEAAGTGTVQKKQKKGEEVEDEEDESAAGAGPENSGDNQPRTLKRPRLVWTPQLHKRFVDAVSHLGIKNAVPKTIMQLMNVEGLTRENVASHLQKYRLYLKRMQGLSSDGPTASDHLFASTPLPPRISPPSTHPHPMYRQMMLHRDDMSQGSQGSQGGQGYYRPGPGLPPHHANLGHENLASLNHRPYNPYEHHGYNGISRQMGPRSSMQDPREFMVEAHGPPPGSPPQQKVLSLFPSSGN